jgi:hypothetical protein
MSSHSQHRRYSLAIHRGLMALAILLPGTWACARAHSPVSLTRAVQQADAEGDPDAESPTPEFSAPESAAPESPTPESTADKMVDPESIDLSPVDSSDDDDAMNADRGVRLRARPDRHDPDYVAPGVDEGGQALRDSSYPWYDPSTDELRPIKFRDDPPPPPPKPEVESSGVGGGVLEIVAWCVIALVVGTILFFVIRAFLLGDFTTAGAAARRAGAAAPSFDALPVAAVTAKTDLLAEARRLYEEGDYAQAMVYLYSHLLLRLDRGQYLRLARGKTNRQYLRELTSRPLRDILQPAMWAFEEAFFGRHALARTRFEDQWQRLDEFHRLVDEAAST